MQQNRKAAPPGLYTAQEAREIIGVQSTTFYNLVKAGEIKKITPKGRKEGFYSKMEVDTYARIRRAIEAPYANETMDFVPAFNEDLPYIHQLVASVSGGEAHAVPVDVLKGWVRRNPQSVHILRQHTEIMGYVAMFPLKQETLMKRQAGQLLNRQIPFDDILDFKPKSSITLYVAEMAVKHRPEFLVNNEPTTDPDKTKLMAQERTLGARLIRELIRFIADLKDQDIIVNGFYAVGTSQFGIDMCEKLGMYKMDLPTGVREDRMPFELNMQQMPDSSIIRRLLAA